MKVSRHLFNSVFIINTPVLDPTSPLSTLFRTEVSIRNYNMSSLLPAPPQEDADVMYREEVLIDGIQEEETSTDTNNNHENNDINATALLNHNQTGSIEGVPFAPTFGNVDTQSMIPTSYATAQCSSPFASILHKYRIRSWNDLSRTSVLNSDIQDLVKTAAFVFFPGVHLEISMTNGQKKQYTCAFEGCEWSCSFLKQQGNSRSESLWKFQDSALESERRKKSTARLITPCHVCHARITTGTSFL